MNTLVAAACADATHELGLGFSKSSYSTASCGFDAGHMGPLKTGTGSGIRAATGEGDRPTDAVCQSLPPQAIITSSSTVLCGAWSAAFQQSASKLIITRCNVVREQLGPKSEIVLGPSIDLNLSTLAVCMRRPWAAACGIKRQADSIM